METLTDLLRETAIRHADRVAATYRTPLGVAARWTYPELAQQARRTGAWLQNQGVRPGDRVILWSPNRPEWVAAFFGILAAGAVAVPLDMRGARDFVDRVHDKAGPVLRLIGDIEPDQIPAGPPTYPLSDLVALTGDTEPMAWEDVPIGPGDLAELVFTSGTTGTPKGVMLSHGNVVANALDCQFAVPRLSAYRLLSVLPLSHMFEQTGGLLTGLLVGATNHYVSLLQANLLFETLEQERITMMCVVPQVLQLFLRGVEREVERTGKQRAWRILHAIGARSPRPVQRLLFRSLHRKLGGELQVFFCGGAYLDWSLAQKWENAGIRVYQGYGTTEASPVVSANTEADRQTTSVGKPLRSVQVRIADDSEILVRGPNVTRGYWQDPEATAAAFDGDWYKTGDLGYLDTAGFVYLRGRKKNMIVLSSGLNVYPEDVENVLLRQPGVRDALVVGLNRSGDTEIFAVLLLEEGADGAQVVRAANARLGQHQRVRGHWIWPDEDFPRTHTMKARRPDIEQRISRELGVKVGHL